MNYNVSKISELKRHNLILAHQKGLIYDDGQSKVELNLNISRYLNPGNAIASEQVWKAIQNNGSSVYLHTLVYRDDDSTNSLDNVQLINIQVRVLHFSFVSKVISLIDFRVAMLSTASST